MIVLRLSMQDEDIMQVPCGYIDGRLVNHYSNPGRGLIMNDTNRPSDTIYHKQCSYWGEINLYS
jgi:hypothetical protein